MTGPTDPTIEGGATHPDELLAGYVDATLTPAEREQAEGHLAACATCTEEVALAQRARAGLTALPGLDVPIGVTGPVVQSARRGPSRLARVTWAAGAAAAAAVIGVFAWSALQGVGPAGESTAPPVPKAATAGGDGSVTPSSGFPVKHSATNYDAASIHALAANIARRPLRRFSTASLSPAPSTAARVPSPAGATGAPAATAPKAPLPPLRCVQQVAGSDSSPIEIIEARFESQPVYIGVFAQPGLITVWVVSKSHCTELSAAISR